MKQLAQGLILLSVSVGVMAEPIFHPAGENLTNGPIANFQSVIGHTNNPATGASALAVQEWNIGIGLVSSVGFGLELGPVDNLTSQLEGLSDQLELFESNPSQELATEISDNFDGFLEEAGEKGYLQLHMGIHPIAPIVWNSRNTLGGSLVFDVNVAVQAQLNILDAPLIYNTTAQGAELLQTNSAVYLKVGAIAESSLAYSRSLYKNDYGTLYSGVRAKYYLAELRKSLTGVSQIEDAQKLLEDELDIAISGEQALGVDLGLMWASDFYRAGATVRNINSPSFSYETVGLNCDTKTGAVQDSCNIAKSFSGEIDLEEKWVMDPQINLEFALYNSSRNWFMAVSGDVSPVNDAVGNELQWFTASVGYATRSWLLPGARLGYRKNLAGSQLSTANVGLSLFKILHLDVAYGLESIKAEGLDLPQTGNTVPRILQVNLGIDLLF